MRLIQSAWHVSLSRAGRLLRAITRRSWREAVSQDFTRQSQRPLDCLYLRTKLMRTHRALSCFSKCTASLHARMSASSPQGEEAAVQGPSLSHMQLRALLLAVSGIVAGWVDAVQSKLSGGAVCGARCAVLCASVAIEIQPSLEYTHNALPRASSIHDSPAHCTPMNA
jgi:hypothetical protein